MAAMSQALHLYNPFLPLCSKQTSYTANRSLPLAHRDVGSCFKINFLDANGLPKPSFFLPHWSSNPNRWPLCCNNGRTTAMPDKEPSLDRITSFQKTLTMVVHILSTLTVFAGTALFFWLAPASANLLVARTPSTTTFSNIKLLRMIGGAEVLTSAWTGLIAGCLHTLTGPDHLAALAPLSIGRTKLESLAVGALWGCGHDAGQVIFGILFLLLKDRLHIEVVRTWGTRVVGITLLLIGALGIKEAHEVVVPCLAGSETNMLQKRHSNRSKFGFATFATGIVHGLQPDALLMVLPALALPSRLAGSAFLLMFLFGTVLAMGSYTAFIGSCSQALRKKGPRITEQLSLCSSFVAILIGSAILVNVQLGGNLF